MGHSIDAHFEGKSPCVRENYDTIVATGCEFGPVEEDAKKTSIHLDRKSAFAGVQARKNFLILTVKATNHIESPRISRSEQASANRWYHEIKLSEAGEIDAELIAWLRDSYNMAI